MGRGGIGGQRRTADGLPQRPKQRLLLQPAVDVGYPQREFETLHATGHRDRRGLEQAVGGRRRVLREQGPGLGEARPAREAVPEHHAVTRG